MPNKVVEMTGKRFGRLVVLERHPISNKEGCIRWVCECNCGNVVVCDGPTLRSGQRNSCGCLFNDVCRTHGLTGTKTYASWSAMKSRCYNQNDQEYHNYGGRGIKVCARWRHSFENFLMDMGKRTTSLLTLERKDTNGNYEPANCKWATWAEQAQNKRPFSEQHKQNMRHPKRKGYKQTKEHIESRVESYKKTIEAKRKCLQL